MIKEAYEAGVASCLQKISEDSGSVPLAIGGGTLGGAAGLFGGVRPAMKAVSYHPKYKRIKKHMKRMLDSSATNPNVVKRESKFYSKLQKLKIKMDRKASNLGVGVGGTAGLVGGSAAGYNVGGSS